MEITIECIKVKQMSKEFLSFTEHYQNLFLKFIREFQRRKKQAKDVSQPKVKAVPQQTTVLLKNDIDKKEASCNNSKMEVRDFIRKRQYEQIECQKQQWQSDEIEKSKVISDKISQMMNGASEHVKALTVLQVVNTSSKYIKSVLINPDDDSAQLHKKYKLYELVKQTPDIHSILLIQKHKFEKLVSNFQLKKLEFMTKIEQYQKRQKQYDEYITELSKKIARNNVRHQFICDKLGIQALHDRIQELKKELKTSEEYQKKYKSQLLKASRLIKTLNIPISQSQQIINQLKITNDH